MDELENRRPYMKQYYVENKERMRQQCREWYSKNKKVIENLIKTKSIIEVVPKRRGRPRIHPDIVIKPKEKKPKTAVIERKRKLIERNLEEIQKKAEAFKLSLQYINGERKTNEGGNQKGEDSGDEESE